MHHHSVVAIFLPPFAGEIPVKVLPVTESPCRKPLPGGKTPADSARRSRPRPAIDAPDL